jgi:EAL domain-containing protein (putative c-di-GMP-specific phosphodiesterase class I)
VVAEGVETEDVLVRLVACGCDVVQGNVYAKPLSPEGVAAFLDRWERVAEAVQAT